MILSFQSTKYEVSILSSSKVMTKFTLVNIQANMKQYAPLYVLTLKAMKY